MAPQPRNSFAILLVSLNAAAALPEPPKQHALWNPPVTHLVPDYAIEAAAVLFDAGLADPRGGRYQEVRLPISRNGGNAVTTHAWVFEGRIAVAWNGLTYRVESIGSAANLDRDVRTIVHSRPWGARLTVSRSPYPPSAAFWHDLETCQTLAPVAISLLLRLGRPDLAAAIWRAPESQDVFGQIGAHEDDAPSFSRGDDREAVQIGESLLNWRARVPQNWRARNTWVPKRIPDISFLDHVDVLVTDAARRLRESRPASLNSPEVDRIAYLVKRLEDVQGTKQAWPGPLSFNFDPIYVELRELGDEAVLPLIRTWESDDRLTRTMDYSRPWSIEYVPVSVRDVADLLIRDIISDRGGIRSSDPPMLLKWWEEWGGRLPANGDP